jgi:hypothetical protein
VVTAPVAGSVTGPQLPDVPSTDLPPIQWLTVFMGELLRGFPHSGVLQMASSGHDLPVVLLPGLDR